MRKNLLLSGLVVALCTLVACSKQNGQSAGSGNTSSGNSSEGSIVLLNIYSIQLNGAAYLLTELQNNGNTSIKAFQGKWTMTDDLGAKVADDDIKYTSETQFATTNDVKTAHVIAPGDKFVMVEQSVTGQPDNVFAMKKEDVGAVIGVLGMAFKETPLESYKATKKTTFELEKVVSN